MRSKLAALVVAFAACAFALAGPAAADTGPTPPDQPTVETSGTGTTVEVSPFEALKAASIPGASTEGSVATSDVQVTATDTTAVKCWYNSTWAQWSVYPFQMRLTDYRYWCGHLGGTLTYRTDHIVPSTSICSSGATDSWRVSGGVGYSYVTAHAIGAFACPTPVPWVTWHYNWWMNVTTNSVGSIWVSAQA